LLPFAVQFLHSFETHEQLACNSQHTIHFDTHEIDCSVFHFKINHNTIEFSSNFAIVENVLTDEKKYATEDQISSIKIHHKSPRGPPFLLL
jgi:hypothetical protein